MKKILLTCVIMAIITDGYSQNAAELSDLLAQSKQIISTTNQPHWPSKPSMLATNYSLNSCEQHQQPAIPEQFNNWQSFIQHSEQARRNITLCD